MAIISTQQKSGSVGPSTFVSSPYGLVERQRVVPCNPRTPAQEVHRGFVAAMASRWRELSAAQRAGWRALAAQLPGHLSGCNAYVKVNVTRLHCALATEDTAPPPPSFGILICTGLLAEAIPLVKLTGVTATVAPDAFVIEACKPLSPGVEYVEKRFRQVLVVPGHAGPGADIDLTAAYVARFGAPRVGRRLFVRLSAMKDGFKDRPVQVDAIVGAGGA